MMLLKITFYYYYYLLIIIIKCCNNVKITIFHLETQSNNFIQSKVSL